MSSNNNSKLLVSVVIPGYKHQYILETIDSVLCQTYHNIEIIVVDDGSPHNLSATLSSLTKAGKIRYIHQSNQKMAAARNNGIKNAKGKLIAFIDDDDKWEPTKIEKQVRLFRDDSVAIVYCFAEGFTDTGSVPIPNFEIEKKGRICNDIFLQDFIANSSVVVRKRCFEQIGLFNTSPTYFGVDDCDMWTRITCNHKADVVPEKLTRIRLHKDRFSADKNLMIENDIFVRKCLIKSCNIRPYYARKYFQRIYFELGYHAKNSDKITAAKYYTKSFISYPSITTLFALIKLLVN